MFARRRPELPTGSAAALFTFTPPPGGNGGGEEECGTDDASTDLTNVVTCTEVDTFLEPVDPEEFLADVEVETS